MIDFTRVLFFRLLEKVVVFFYFFLFFIITLYISGNFQFFLDSTQTMLLRISEITAFILVFLSLLYGIAMIVSGAGTKRKLLKRFLFFLLAFISGTAVFFISKIILVWAA